MDHAWAHACMRIVDTDCKTFITVLCVVNLFRKITTFGFSSGAYYTEQVAANLKHFDKSFAKEFDTITQFVLLALRDYK